VSFTIEGQNDYLELGEGRGVFQEGLTLYWMSLLETGLFDRNSKRKNNNKVATNVNGNHWFTLGLLMGNALLNHFSFFIDQPRCFFKIVNDGPYHLDVRDLADIDRNEAISL